MGDYPWSVLELEPTSDLRLIRKAYAAKLRANRPEDDPEGFQFLVEARDFALRLAPQIELLPSFPIAESTFESEKTSVSEAQHVAEPAKSERGETQPDGPPDLLTRNDQQVAVPFVASIKAPELPVEAQQNEVPSAETSPETGQSSVSQKPPLSSFPMLATPSEIAQLLQALDQPSPVASTLSRWSYIFDRAELAPLENHDLIMALIVRRLVQDLHDRAYAGYGDGLFPKKPRNENRPAVLEMGMVLIDFEKHFRLLDEDKILRRYLPDDDALFLIDAMSLACGRESHVAGRTNVPPPISRLHAAPIIDLDFLEAAYRQDAAILDYYNECRKIGRYTSNFSWFALVLPLSWAMCYRLTGLAWLFVVLMGMMVGISVIHHFGRTTEIDDLVPAVFVSITFACAFQANRLRLQELARSVSAIQRKPGTHQMHIDLVHRKMHRSRILAAFGLILTGGWIYLTILFEFVLDVITL